MFESRISSGLWNNNLFPGSRMRIFPHGPMTWKVMQRSAWKNANWPTKQRKKYKVATPCIDDHQFLEEEMGSVGELAKVCFQIVLKCLFLARIGRPDFMVREQTCPCSSKMCILSCTRAWTQTRTRTRRSHHITTPTTTTMGWRFVTDSSWTLWHPSGSRQGHPRYTGARAREGRGWPDRHLVRHHSTRPIDKPWINRVCRNKSHCNLEIIQNGVKLVTNVWCVWCLTFIIHVNTDNTVMWETRHNNAD